MQSTQLHIALLHKSALAKQHRALIEAQKNKIVASHLTPHRKTVESEGYVEERTQWRLNLMFPLEGDGLSENEMCLLAGIIDLEKYPWGYAQLLTADIPLAQWLSSKPINDLIFRDKLTFQKHGALLTEPNQRERDSLQALAPFILNNQLSVEKALNTYISEEARQMLLKPEFVARAISSTLNHDDLALLISINLSLNKEDEQEDALYESSSDYSYESSDDLEESQSDLSNSDDDDYSAVYSSPRAKPKR